MVCSYLLSRFLCTSRAAADLPSADLHADLKSLVVIRSFFFQEFIDQALFVFSLNQFLQDSFAIIKQKVLTELDSMKIKNKL